MASAVELPTFKGRPGWEFTDISSLNLAAYEPVRSADELDGAQAIERLFGGAAAVAPASSSDPRTGS